MLRSIIAKEFGLFTLDKFKHTNVRMYLKLYNDSVNWSKDKIESYQIRKIRELLRYASRNTDFYRKRFEDSGFNWETFKYFDQLEKIPILTRKDLRENLSSLISKEIDINQCKKGTSSGSTGDPVTYFHDNESFSAGRASNIFCKALGGYKLGDRWLNIWGNPTAVNIEWKRPSSRISKYIFHENRFPAYKLSNSSEFERLLKLILSIKPKFIYGYTNAIFLLSEFIREKSIKIDFVKGVFTTAENLHEYQRKSIESSIGNVFDQYGSSEINGIAAESNFGNNYCVIAPHVYVEYGEIVDPDTNSRKLILTSFENRVLPFIRYENGDLATPVDSSNNKAIINFPQLKSVEGRVSDIIKLPSGGTLVVPSFFGSRMLKNIDGITQYQIVKKESNKIDINLVTNSRFKEEYIKIIDKTLEEYIPTELKYELVFNKPIIMSKNNKFKLLIDLSSDKV